jgi:undecaprenyl diphosphate synthase
VDEVEGLMHILEEVIDKELDELDKEGVQLKHIGRLEQLSSTLRKKVERSIEVTKDNNRLTLCIAWNYGGRDEIVHAIQNMIKDGIKPDQVNDALVSKYLFTAGIPDPDLIIRTSGEMRISNFLIWQGSYSEWYFTQTLWPDFDREELFKALIVFNQRDRRYGRLSECAEEDENNAG